MTMLNNNTTDILVYNSASAHVLVPAKHYIMRRMPINTVEKPWFLTSTEVGTYTNANITRLLQANLYI